MTPRTMPALVVALATVAPACSKRGEAGAGARQVERKAAEQPAAEGGPPAPAEEAAPEPEPAAEDEAATGSAGRARRAEKKAAPELEDAVKAGMPGSGESLEVGRGSGRPGMAGVSGADGGERAKREKPREEAIGSASDTMAFQEAATDERERGAGEATPKRGKAKAKRAKRDPPPDDAPDDPLPRNAFFRNTYLAGNAAHEAAVRELDERLEGDGAPWTHAHLPAAAIDPPQRRGLAVRTALDRAWLDEPGRVHLRVALRGSERYGWRRAPMDVVLVAHPKLEPSTSWALTTALLRRLGPGDRVGVVRAGRTPEVPAEPDAVERVRRRLARRAEDAFAGDGDTARLAPAMERAGTLLSEAADEEARVPGTGIVLVAVPGSGDAAGATKAAHRLTVQGAVTSVVEVGAPGGADWWRVAAAGHGHHHRARPDEGGPTADEAIAEELELLGRVVARLVRVRIELAEGVEATAILGSEILSSREAERVREREKAIDEQLSRAMGIGADRAEDESGLRTVIPAFHGGDAHSILLELHADEPGPVADVTVRYKDLVRVGNATTRARVTLEANPTPKTPGHRAVRRSVRGFELARRLREAAGAVRRSGVRAASSGLSEARRHAVTEADRKLLDGLTQLVERSPSQELLAETFDVAADRRVGMPAPE